MLMQAPIGTPCNPGYYILSIKRVEDVLKHEPVLDTSLWDDSFMQYDLNSDFQHIPVPNLETEVDQNLQTYYGQCLKREADIENEHQGLPKRPKLELNVSLPCTTTLSSPASPSSEQIIEASFSPRPNYQDTTLPTLPNPRFPSPSSSSSSSSSPASSSSSSSSSSYSSSYSSLSSSSSSSSSNRHPRVTTFQPRATLSSSSSRHRPSRPYSVGSNSQSALGVIKKERPKSRPARKITAVVEKLWRCDQSDCDKTFVYKRGLRRHKIISHDGGYVAELRSCPLCRKKFTQKSSLVRHFNTQKHLRRTFSEMLLHDPQLKAEEFCSDGKFDRDCVERAWSEMRKLMKIEHKADVEMQT